MPAHTNQVAEVQQLKKLEPALSHNVLLYVDLDAPPHTLQVCKPGLAHQAQRNDAPGNADFSAGGLQLRARGRAKLGCQLRNRVAPPKLVWVRCQAQRLDLLQLFLALLKLLAWLKWQRENPFRISQASIAATAIAGQESD